MFKGIKNEINNAWRQSESIVIQFIIINIVIFVVLNIVKVLLFFSASIEMYETIRKYISLPSNLQTLLTRPWTLITYMFVHQSFFHIFFNMLWLYWFGRLVNEFLGSKRVLGLYVLGGISGGIFFIVFYNLLPNFQEAKDYATLIGASASTSALIVGAAIYFPNFTMYLLFFGPVKIKYIASIVVFLSFVGTTGSNAGGEFAHIGGAFLGWIFISQLKKGNDWSNGVAKSLQFLQDLFTPKPKIRVSHRKTSKPKSPESQSKKPTPMDRNISQEEIDEILDKISQSGYESLTKEEKQKLFNASQ